MSDPVLFPYPPERGELFRHSLRYLTDILTAYATDEQRISLRSFPSGRIEFTVRRSDPATEAEIVSLLRLHQHDYWRVPLWPYALRTSAPLYGGETMIPCTAPVAGRGLDVVPWKVTEWQEEAWLLLYDSPSRCQALQFAGLSATSGYGSNWNTSWGKAPETSPAGPRLAVMIHGMVASWGYAWGYGWGVRPSESPVYPAGSLVIPMRLARLDPAQTAAADGLRFEDLKLAWELEEETT